MAMVYELNHDTVAAKECYLKTLTLDPGYLQANERLARILFGEGDYREARRYFNQQLEITEPNAELLNDLGNCAFKLGDDSEAQKQYRKALVVNPDYAPTWRNLGLSLARTNRFSEAVDLLDRYLTEQIDPGVVEIFADLASSIGQSGRAIPHLERQLQMNPADLRALFKLSECYLAMGHKDAALVGYRRVLLQDPDFAPAQARIEQLEPLVDLPATRV